MFAVADQEDFELLFNGASFYGWEGNTDIWQIRDKAIVGGSLQNSISKNEFLCTLREFSDFELHLEARMSSGQIGGVSFRAHRVPSSTEVGGYQADMGFIAGEFMPIVSDLTDVDSDELYPLWGSLMDEYRPDRSRYPDPEAPYRLIAVAHREVVDEVLQPDDWNSVTVMATGSRIEIRLNGTKTTEFTERGDVPSSGFICLQVHYGPPSEASYRDIRLREL